MVCLGSGKDSTAFKNYAFMNRAYTNCFTMSDIVNKEQGKKGLEDLQKMQSQIAKEQAYEKKKESSAVAKSESNSQRMTMKKSLALKDKKVTTTIQKKEAPKSVGSKRSASKTVSAKSARAKPEITGRKASAPKVSNKKRTVKADAKSKSSIIGKKIEKNASGEKGIFLSVLEMKRITQLMDKMKKSTHKK